MKLLLGSTRNKFSIENGGISVTGDFFPLNDCEIPINGHLFNIWRYINFLWGLCFGHMCHLKDRSPVSESSKMPPADNRQTMPHPHHMKSENGMVPIKTLNITGSFTPHNYKSPVYIIFTIS